MAGGSGQAVDIIDDREHSFDLFDEAGPAAELKTSQPPLHDKYEASGFMIGVRCMYKIHGHLDGPGSPAPSLVVVKVTLRSKSDDCRRFYRKFCAKFTLKSDPPRDPIDEPYVLAYEPAGKGAIRVTDTSTKITAGRSYEFSGGVQPGPIPTSLDAKSSKTKQEEYEQQSAYTVVADTEQTVGEGGGREGDNIVEWTCHADRRQTSGVGDFISFAMLVHRADVSRPLMVHIDLEATVDWRYWVADKWKSLMDEKKTRYLPLRISNKPSGTLPDGIDIDRLESAARQLQRFGFIHVPEKMAPETFYRQGELAFQNDRTFTSNADSSAE